MPKDLSKPKKQWNVPVVLALAAVIFLIASIFAFGFWLGMSSMQEPVGKVHGTVIEKAGYYKIKHEPFVKMPEELP